MKLGSRIDNAIFFSIVAFAITGGAACIYVAFIEIGWPSLITVVPFIVGFLWPKVI